MKNKLIKKQKAMNESSKANHNLYALFEDGKPNLELRPRELQTIKQHKDFNKWREELQHIISENQSNEPLLDQVSDLLENMENPRLLSYNAVDTRALERQIRDLPFIEAYKTLFEEIENEITDLFGYVTEDTELKIKNKIDDYLDDILSDIFESDFQDQKNEILQATQRFIKENEVTFFIKEDIIEKLKSLQGLFTEAEIRKVLDKNENIQEIREAMSWNPDKANKDYYSKITQVLESLNPAQMPKIDEAMTKEQINQAIKNNPQELLWSQVQVKLKSQKIQEDKRQKSLNNLNDTKLDEEEIEVQKGKKKAQDKELFEQYSKVLKVFERWNNMLYKSLGITEKHLEDDEKLKQGLSSYVESIRSPYNYIEKIEELYPITEHFDLKNPQSLIGARFVIDEVRNTEAYTKRVNVIEKKIQEQKKEPQETVFLNRDGVSVLNLDDYLYLVKPSDNKIYFEIIFNKNRLKELGLEK